MLIYLHPFEETPPTAWIGCKDTTNKANTQIKTQKKRKKVHFCA